MLLGPGEDDDDLSPLLRNQGRSSPPTESTTSSSIQTPVSSPEPPERDASSKLPAFLEDSWLDRNYRVVFLAVELLLWATVYYIFIVFEFGFVYFTLSVFYFIWRNTRTRRKKREGEMSAYSVFNPNCEPIHGTVSPTQLTRELGLAVPVYT